jgi:hypothetical protein
LHPMNFLVIPTALGTHHRGDSLAFDAKGAII